MWVNDEPVDGGYILYDQIDEISFELQMETVLMLMIFSIFAMLLEQ